MFYWQIQKIYCLKKTPTSKKFIRIKRRCPSCKYIQRTPLAISFYPIHNALWFFFFKDSFEELNIVLRINLWTSEKFLCSWKPAFHKSSCWVKIASQFMMSKIQYNDFCHLFNDNLNFGNINFFHLC